MSLKLSFRSGSVMTLALLALAASALMITTVFAQVAPPGEIDRPEVDVRPGAVALTWNSPGGDVTGYEVKRTHSQYDGSQREIETFTTTATNYTDSTVAELTWYSFQVRGVNSAGPGPWATAWVMTGVANPSAAPAPQNLVADVSTAGQVVLTWDAPAGHSGNYAVYRGTHMQRRDVLTRIAHTLAATTYTDSTVGSEERYIYAIRSEGPTDGEDSSYSNRQQVLTLNTTNKPSRPIMVVYREGSGARVNLKGLTDAENTAITVFKVQRKQHIPPQGESGSRYVTVDLTVTKNPDTSFDNYTRHLDTGVTTTHRYDYRARATNSNGDGKWTEWNQQIRPMGGL